MSGVSCRKLSHWKHADRGSFRDMDNLCFPANPSFDNDKDYHWWVVYEGSTPVGYAALCVVAWSGDGKRIKKVKFTRCGVLPGHRGRGYQKVLIAARLRWCRRMGIEHVKTYAWSKNTHSIKNLVDAGFHQRRDGDWINFWKELS